MAVDKVSFIDGTLREGDQAPGVWLDLKDKRRIFHMLDEAGVDVVDAGMPAISEEERALLTELSSVHQRRAKIAASVRCKVEEVRLAAECGVDAAFVIFPVSPLHRQRLGVDRSSWRRMGHVALEACRASGLQAYLVLEDASRAMLDDLVEASMIAIDGGAQHIIACDTVGTLTPGGAYRLAETLIQITHGKVQIGAHFHNDFGMATANTVQAIEAGATWAAVTANGVGERAGNACLAEVAAACSLLPHVHCDIDLSAMHKLSNEVERLTGIVQSPNAPLVGRRTFDHESGIHVDGILKDARNYEPIDPATLGRSRRLTPGKHTGLAGLRHFAEERGLRIEDDAIRAALTRLKAQRPKAHRTNIEHMLSQLSAQHQAQETLLDDAAADALRAATSSSNGEGSR